MDIYTVKLLSEDYYSISSSLNSKTETQMLFPSFSSLDPLKMMWNPVLESKTRKLRQAVLWPVLPRKRALKSVCLDLNPIVSLTYAPIYPSVKWDVVMPVFTGLF